jgi:hypothetical protein
MTPASGASPYVIWIGERNGQELLRCIDGIQQNTTTRSGKQLSSTPLVIEMQSNKWHTFNSTASGQKLIVDGKFAGSSDASPWFTKCRQ